MFFEKLPMAMSTKKDRAFLEKFHDLTKGAGVLAAMKRIALGKALRLILEEKALQRKRDINFTTSAMRKSGTTMRWKKGQHGFWNPLDAYRGNREYRMRKTPGITKEQLWAGKLPDGRWDPDAYVYRMTKEEGEERLAQLKREGIAHEQMDDVIEAWETDPAIEEHDKYWALMPTDGSLLNSHSLMNRTSGLGDPDMISSNIDKDEEVDFDGPGIGTAIDPDDIFGENASLQREAPRPKSENETKKLNDRLIDMLQDRMDFNVRRTGVGGFSRARIGNEKLAFEATPKRKKRKTESGEVIHEVADYDEWITDALAAFMNGKKFTSKGVDLAFNFFYDEVLARGDRLRDDPIGVIVEAKAASPQAILESDMRWVDKINAENALGSIFDENFRKKRETRYNRETATKQLIGRDSSGRYKTANHLDLIKKTQRFVGYIWNEDHVPVIKQGRNKGKKMSRTDATKWRKKETLRLGKVMFDRFMRMLDPNEPGSIKINRTSSWYRGDRKTQSDKLSEAIDMLITMEMREELGDIGITKKQYTEMIEAADNHLSFGGKGNY